MAAVEQGAVTGGAGSTEVNAKEDGRVLTAVFLLRCFLLSLGDVGGFDCVRGHEACSCGKTHRQVRLDHNSTQTAAFHFVGTRIAAREARPLAAAPTRSRRHLCRECAWSSGAPIGFAPEAFSRSAAARTVRASATLS